MFIELTPEYMLGIEAIDEQHLKICEWINTLHDHSQKDLNPNKITETLNNLAEYTQKHFSYEEKIMFKYKLPGLAEHIKQHREFFIILEAMMDEYLMLEEEEAKPFTNRLLNFLQEWLLDHIMKEDMKIRDVMTD
ncbi:conserved hypothetical protein [Candidatus Terasakiella magnetica]|uniref:Hemerythrin-like domain-containing protein n=1 Tax=Candidatus Terasakiella magnetica TaxID=1867952 RepID=A0A1C3RFS1_9PROT|nr:bacteriohemerythrin [Candidatus Terasakiella magnetica]SCA56101.1 conserved hypothetical protein [Candidatus Terasakiella magnetica]